MINQKEIAKTLGLSIMTVSRALRDHPDLSEQTKARVIQKAREMGYSRIPVAATKTSQQRRVAVLAYERKGSERLFDSDVHRAIFLAIQKECQKQGVETVVEFPQQGQLPISVKNSTVSGAFVFGRYTPQDVAPLRGLPTLAVSSFTTEKMFARIVADNFGGMAEVTEHIIKLGHKKILFVGRREDNTELHRERENGYAVTMYRYGLTPQPLYLHEKELDAHLPSFEPYTAVACSCDGLAGPLLKLLQKQGIPVPGRFAVAGFDDLPSSSALNITTYAPDWERMGRLAANLMLLNPGSLQDNNIRIIVPGQLVVRGSTQA